MNIKQYDAFQARVEAHPAPCKYGHIDCSDRNGGLCSDEEEPISSKLAVTPVQHVSSHRTGVLHNVTRERIESVLGFGPNASDDPYKVTASWAFVADGDACAIWDYKGSFNWHTASCFGPHHVMRALFGDDYEPGDGLKRHYLYKV